MNAQQAAFARAWQGPPNEEYFDGLRALGDPAEGAAFVPPSEPAPLDGLAPPAELSYEPADEEPPFAGEPAIGQRAAGERSRSPRPRRAAIAGLVVERQGLGFAAVEPVTGVRLTLDHLRESRGELRGLLSVETERDGHLHWGTFAVSSLEAQKRTAGYLATRDGSHDWAGLLERFRLGIRDEVRQADPVERIGRRPSLAAPPRLVEPCLPEGEPTVVYAPHGAGKTTLAQAIAVAVVSGREIVPGWNPTRQGAVLVLDWESSAQEWNDAIARIAAGAGLEAPEILYRRCYRPLADDLEEHAAVVTREDVALLIVDSTGLAAGQAREGADASDTAERIFGALRALGRTSLLTDHVTGEDVRNGAERTISKPYGSIMKLARARAAFELKREREAPPGDQVAEIVVHCRKMTSGPVLPPLGLRIVYDGLAGPIRFERSAIEAPELVRTLSQGEQMARLLRGGPLSPKAIALALEIAESNVRTIVTRDRGRRFTRLPDGRLGLCYAG